MTVNTAGVTSNLSRREFSALASAAFLPPAAAAQTDPAEPLIFGTIPSTGEHLPAVGLGTASVFNNNDEQTRRAAAQVLQALVDGNGRLIDTASSYGGAESVLGSVIAAADLQDKVFLATKLEAPDAAELRRSLGRLRMAKVDLLQLHNVTDPRQSLAQLKAWKVQGLCRYIGITSTYHGEFAALATVLGREKPDFVQVDYSLDNRKAQERILPLAAEVGAAVLTALPFGRGRLFRAVRGRQIPDWAQDFSASWAQFFLKYLLGDERVTAVIPGTSDAAHMADNLGAMRGRLPGAQERQRMVSFVGDL